MKLKIDADDPFATGYQDLEFDQMEDTVISSGDFCEDKTDSEPDMEYSYCNAFKNSIGIKNNQSDLLHVEEVVDSSEFLHLKPIGLAESPLREKYGLPEDCLLIPKVLTKVEAKQRTLEQIQEIIDESRYIWIQHTPDNARRLISGPDDILEEEDLQAYLEEMPD
eukprot:CAMPEP_0197015288 /NCGR_PEP_ID=MMETSP1380-20130617/73646_1 /TAXON_ID=5936 /ORGANISM="Euplotes crassus, Strain CT5" /LENGTH=164 /DNA_ID=CAMNT_0042441095 /DNA_START=334 /DNA_END=829 /DNA_ORIENTATION=+